MEIQVLEARSSKGYRKKVCAYCRVSTECAGTGELIGKPDRIL